MTVPRDWDQWAETWRADETSPARLDLLLERAARTRRALRLLPLLSLGVTVIALGAIIAALRHAGNIFEAALGIVVAIGICVAWMANVADRRLAMAAVEATPKDYVMVRRVYCERRLRFARLGQIVAVLDLVFLTPWWIGGVQIHGIGYGYGHIASVWLPLAIIFGLIAWTRRVTRSARAELATLSELGDPW